MTEKRLFKVVELAAFIHKATGMSERDIGSKITFAGQRSGLLPYNNGIRMGHWPIGMVRFTSDKPYYSLRLCDEAESLYFRVDIYELMEALGFHSDVQAKILEERDKSVQVESVAPASGSRQSGQEPQQRGHAREERILNVIRDMGYAPKALPPNVAGRSGVKREIKRTVGSAGIWAGNRVFDKAWESLLRSGDIAYSD